MPGRVSHRNRSWPASRCGRIGALIAIDRSTWRDSSGAPVFALPRTTFGPDLPVHVHFEVAGTYRLWGQFRLASGRIITIPFTVEAWPPTRSSAG